MYLVNQDLNIQSLSVDELKADEGWWKIYKKSFPPNELEPDEVIKESVRRDVGLALSARRGEDTVGMSFGHLLESPAATFCVYIAAQEKRKGTGSKLLEALDEIGGEKLRGKGLDYNGTIWESDEPHEGGISTEEQRVRLDRLKFFKKNGGIVLPQRYFQPDLENIDEMGDPVLMLLMHLSDGGEIPDTSLVERLVKAMFREKYGEINGVTEKARADLMRHMGFSV
jgi:hypothetical protein